MTSHPERRSHTELWLVAFLAFVVGDSVTTAVGLSVGAVEGNPVAATVLDAAGLPGMVLLKGAIVLALYGLYLGYDRATATDVTAEAAVLLAGLGLVVTTWNVAVIAVH